MELVEERLIPTGYRLHQNYPNPFNPGTNIEYTVPQRSHVTLSIFNIMGQEVGWLVNESQAAGAYTVYWDGTDTEGNQVASGVYLYRLKAGNFVDSKKMILLE